MVMNLNTLCSLSTANENKWQTIFNNAPYQPQIAWHLKYFFKSGWYAWKANLI